MKTDIIIIIIIIITHAIEDGLRNTHFSNNCVGFLRPYGKVADITGSHPWGGQPQVYSEVLVIE